MHRSIIDACGERAHNCTDAWGLLLGLCMPQLLAYSRIPPLSALHKIFMNLFSPPLAVSLSTLSSRVLWLPKASVLNLWAAAHWGAADLCLVGHGPLPGGPRPRLGIEKFFSVSHVSPSMKRYQVLVVELELPLHT